MNVAIQPADDYRVTLWYRAFPDGEWQKTIQDGGSEGTVDLVIPAGGWLTEEATIVEYFVDVEGPGGVARSGSFDEPHRFKLY